MIYLDNAATTWPKPRHLIERTATMYVRMGVSPGRGGYDAAVAASDFLNQTRAKLARFFNAPDPNRVIFTSNATDGLNLAIFGLVRPGGHVITTRLEHNSVLRPLYHLQQQGKISCSLIPFDSTGTVDPHDIQTAVRPETCLVVMTHASNVLGSLQPVTQVGRVCARHHIPLLLDASQSAGQVPVDVQQMGLSAVVFTGHKSLYAPPGIGGLILSPGLDIQPTRFGGTGTESKNPEHPRTFPDCLETGTHNLMGIIGLSLALDYLAEECLTAIHEKEIGLAQRLWDGLSAIDGVELYHRPRPDTLNSLAVIPANIGQMNPEDLGAVLDGDFDIAARAGLHCAPLVHDTLGIGSRGSIRFSMGHFNTPAQIDQTIDAMARISASR